MSDEAASALERDLGVVQSQQRSQQGQITEIRDWVKVVDDNVVNGFKEIRDDLANSGKTNPLLLIGFFSVLLTILAMGAALIIFVVNAQLTPTARKATENRTELEKAHDLERKDFESIVRLDERVKVIENTKTQ